MGGYKSTDAYSSTVLGKFILALDGFPGLRQCSISAVYDSSNAEVKVTPMTGGISTYVNRISIGLYTVQYAPPGKAVMGVKVTCINKNYQATVYNPTDKQCNVKITDVNADPDELADAEFIFTCFGR